MGRRHLWAALVGTMVGVLGGWLLLVLVGPLLPGRARRSAAEPVASPSTPLMAPAPNPVPLNPPVSKPVAPGSQDPPVKPPVIHVSRARLAAARAVMQAEIGRIPGTAAAHLRLAGGLSAGVRADHEMEAASVMKVPLMAAVEHAWRSGTLTRTSADEARLRAAITRSDNPSADALIERVGRSQVNAWLEDHGCAGTHLRHAFQERPRPREGENVTTAADMTKLLLAVADGVLVDAVASKEMRRLLLAQQWRQRIPAGLPPGVVVGNKTGTWRGVVNDVAFVETPDGLRYALAVLVNRAGGEAVVSRAIARFAGKVHAALTE